LAAQQGEKSQRLWKKSIGCSGFSSANKTVMLGPQVNPKTNK